MDNSSENGGRGLSTSREPVGAWMAEQKSAPALSAMIDGQASADEAAVALAAWRDDADARACWHAYALVGDVMRSTELGQSARNDECFLRAIRARLAAEPAVLAPRQSTDRAPTVRSAPWRRFTAPAAMVAGVVAVAGMVWVLRAAPEDTIGPVLARDTVRGNSSQSVEAVALIRDRTIDRYLESRRQQSIRRVAQPDGALLRRVDAVVIEDK